LTHFVQNEQRYGDPALDIEPFAVSFIALLKRGPDLPECVIELDEQDVDKAKENVEEMCKRLLANPVIQDYRIEIRS